MKISATEYETFAVGDGATMCGYSDCKAGNVVKVSPNGKRVWVQRDKATLAEGSKPNFIPGGFVAHCTNQRELKYDYEQDPEGYVSEFSLRTWRGKKVWTAKNANPDGRNAVRLGRYEFYDYNF